MRFVCLPFNVDLCSVLVITTRNNKEDLDINYSVYLRIWFISMLSYFNGPLTENLDIWPICRKVWVQKHRYKLKYRSLWGGGIFKIALSSNILKISYIRYCKIYSHARSIDRNSNTVQSTDIRVAALKTMIRKSEWLGQYIGRTTGFDFRQGGILHFTIKPKPALGPNQIV
jgi:hypothetical protein